MLALSDEEITIIRRAAEPLAPPQRRAFHAEMISALACLDERIGPAAIVKVASALQRKYLGVAKGAQPHPTGYHRRPWSATDSR
jgi:hypothetical protein